MLVLERKIGHEVIVGDFIVSVIAVKYENRSVIITARKEAFREYEGKMVLSGSLRVINTSQENKFSLAPGLVCTVSKVHKDGVILGFEAPREVVILRKELRDIELST